MLYFVEVDGQVQGPFNLDELQTKRIVQRDTLVWNAGLTHWTPAERVAELEPLWGAVPPALPSSPAATSWNDAFPPDDQGLYKLFCRLITASIVLTVLSLVLHIVSGAMAGVALEQAGYTQEMAPAQMAFGCAVLLIFVPLMIITWKGLYNLRDWARWLYAGLAGAGWVVGLLAGSLDFSLTWGLPNAVDSIGCTIGGAILAIAFLTPLAHRFANRSATT